MNILLEAFWKICLFRMSPQDLPGSRVLLYSSAFLYMLISAVVSSLSLSFGPAVMSAIVDTLLVTGMTWLLLWTKEMGERFTQTTTALLGTGVVIAVIATPLLWWQAQLGDKAAILPSLLILGLMFWNLAVFAHVLRHALGAPFFVGMIIALVYMVVSINVIRALFVGPT